MITIFKREDIQKILDKEIGFFNEIDLVADKLRTIYVLHGWRHMTDNFFAPNETIEELTDMCLRTLLDNDEKIETNAASAGLHVEAWIDSEGFLNVDYKYILI